MSDWDQELWERINGDEPGSAWEMIHERVNEVLGQSEFRLPSLVPQYERSDVAQDCMEQFVRDDLLGRLRGHTGQPGQLKSLIAREVLDVARGWRLDRGRELQCEPLIDDESLRPDSGD